MPIGQGEVEQDAIINMRSNFIERHFGRVGSFADKIIAFKIMNYPVGKFAFVFNQ